MPLDDEGPDNAATAATKASMIRTRGNRRQANEVLLSPGLLTWNPSNSSYLGGNNDSARRQSKRASKEDGDYMPLEDEGLDNIVATTTKASKSRTIVDTRTIRARAISGQANDVMLSPVDIFNGSSQQVRRDNAAPSSVRQGKCSLLGYLLLLIFLYLHNSVRSICF
ncbi:hypothetical protein Cgig2_015875 [Carnegiea gigantea]|uniref:Uncharacterized protein n=1 Tax=Carnegiea gigantea TaxID=171969 RepID=A0A9Q1GRC6_9CARY|nr:hypothetical protein Cgig2_015875 [Carnegiea gigantea]